MNNLLRRKTLTRRTYELTCEAVAAALKAAEADASLLVYGSFLDDRLLPGVSDIDIILYFWADAVLDARRLAVLAEALRDRLVAVSFDAPMLLDVSVIDDGMARDGRFVPQNENFSKVFDAADGDSRLVYGRSFIERMRPVRLVDPIEARLAFNLQTLRHYLLFGLCQTAVLAKGGGLKELQLLQHVRSVPRKIVALLDGAEAQVKGKRACLTRAGRLLPSLDAGPFKRIEDLFSDPTAVIDAIAAGNVRPLLSDALTAYEGALKDIIATKPMKSCR